MCSCPCMALWEKLKGKLQCTVISHKASLQTYKAALCGIRIFVKQPHLAYTDWQWQSEASGTNFSLPYCRISFGRDWTWDLAHAKCAFCSWAMAHSQQLFQLVKLALQPCKQDGSLGKNKWSACKSELGHVYILWGWRCWDFSEVVWKKNCCLWHVYSSHSHLCSHILERHKKWCLFCAILNILKKQSPICKQFHSQSVCNSTDVTP